MERVSVYYYKEQIYGGYILVLSGQLQEIGLVMSDLHYEVSLRIEEVRASMVENAFNKLLSMLNENSYGVFGLKRD